MRSDQGAGAGATECARYPECEPLVDAAPGASHDAVSGEQACTPPSADDPLRRETTHPPTRTGDPRSMTGMTGAMG